MNIRDMNYLVAVADLRNFSQAAEQCFVSQPTLSGQIKKLEEGLGVKLFERNNKRVIPTEVGAVIVQSARRILQEVDNIKDVAENAHDPLSGKFRLGAFPTLAPYILPDLVPQIKTAMPKLRLMLLEEKTAVLLEKLRRGQLDAALLALPVHDDYLISQPLFVDEFYLAVAPEHPLTQQSQIDASSLVQHKLLLLEEGHCLREQALELCQLHGMSEEEDFRATGLETLRQMVKAGTGITLIPEIAIDRTDNDIRYIPFTAPPPSRTIGLVARKTSTKQAVMTTLCSMLANKT